MAQYTPGPDGVTYVYFWVRILSGDSAAGSGTMTAVAQPFVHAIIFQTLGSTAAGMNYQATAAEGAQGGVEVGLYAFNGTYDASSHKVDIRQMPPGMTREQAAAWIQTDEGKTWAKGAFVFMGHTSIQR